MIFCLISGSYKIPLLIAWNEINSNMSVQDQSYIVNITYLILIPKILASEKKYMGLCIIIMENNTFKICQF